MKSLLLTPDGPSTRLEWLRGRRTPHRCAWWCPGAASDPEAALILACDASEFELCMSIALWAHTIGARTNASQCSMLLPTPPTPAPSQIGGELLQLDKREPTPSQ